MIAFAAEQVKEIEVGSLTGAGHDERSAARLASATVIAAGLEDAGRHGRATHPEAA